MAIDEVTVGEDCLIGAGALLVRDAVAGTIQKGHPAKPGKVGTHEYFELGAT